MDVMLMSSNRFHTMDDSSDLTPEDVLAQMHAAVERIRKRVSTPINIEEEQEPPKVREVASDE